VNRHPRLRTGLAAVAATALTFAVVGAPHAGAAQRAPRPSPLIVTGPLPATPAIGGGHAVAHT
jgi:hypothetical protein